MIEYLPWSLNVLNKTISDYGYGRFTILDIQLGGACNFSCIYCDTPNRNIKSSIDTGWIDDVIKNNKIKWIFICGLGEPTHPQNLNQLKMLLKICKQNNIRCSMFTNLSMIDQEVKSYISDGTLYILFKLDSLESNETTKALFGVTNLTSYNANVSQIHQLVRIENGCTNIAASIVPTKYNKNELIRLVEYCLERNIFPLIGDLEDSGSSSILYENLKVGEDDLILLKKEIEKKYSIYQIPICPSVIGGIHMDFNNNIIIDEDTGLSCHWFWLKEPKIKRLIEGASKFDFGNIANKIIAYRNEKIQQVEEYVNTIQSLPFGGCGGDIKLLLSKYLDAHRNLILT